MAQPFLAEIRLFSFNFAPKGWAFCNGQLLPISQNQALFALLGTTYGGNGQTTFALPNLQGRTPIHIGNGHTLGQSGGEESHVLTAAELPSHSHGVPCSTQRANQRSPVGAARTLAREATGVTAPYGAGVAGPDIAPMSPALLANTGGGQGHENRQPFLAVSFAIALQGIFPSM